MQDLPQIVDFSVDLESWRDDQEALEVYAFAILLYAETHFESFETEIQQKLVRVVSNLSESLEVVKSPLSHWCTEWINGKKTLVRHPEYARSYDSFLLNTKK